MKKQPLAKLVFKSLYGCYRLAQGFSDQAEEADEKIRKISLPYLYRLGDVYDGSPNGIESDPMNRTDIARRLQQMREGRAAQADPESVPSHVLYFVQREGLTRFSGRDRPRLP